MDINEVYKWVFYIAVAAQIVMTVLIPYQQQSNQVLDNYNNSTQFVVYVMNDSGIIPQVVDDNLVFDNDAQKAAFEQYLESIIAELMQEYPDCNIVSKKYQKDSNQIVFIMDKKK